MNLVTGDILTVFTGAFANHFDTFARNRRFITIFKEPQKTFVGPESNYSFAGYDSSVNLSNYILTPVSGVYSAHILYDYKDESLDSLNPEINVKYPNNVLRVKVERDAKDYLLNGKTESVLIDNQLYNEFSQYKVQNFFGLEYYYFEFKQTK